MVRFGPYDVDFSISEVRKSGIRVRVQEQQLRILQALVDRPGELVTRDELRQRLWPENTFVEFDRSLNVAVAKLRQSLNDSADRPLYIETVARKGYRFIAPVTEPAPAANERVLTETQTPQSARVAGSGRTWLAVTGMAVLLVCVLTWAVITWPNRPAETRLVQLDPEVGEPVSQPAVSPDGSAVAFIAGGKVAVRKFEQNQVKPLTGTEGASSPFFSPDGKFIAFFKESRLRAGHRPQSVTRLANVAEPGLKTVRSSRPSETRARFTV